MFKEIPKWFFDPIFKATVGGGEPWGRGLGGGDFQIPNCHEMVLELVCGVDFGATGTAGRAPSF